MTSRPRTPHPFQIREAASPADHHADMLRAVETAIVLDDRASSARPTLARLRARAEGFNMTLISHQDGSGLLIRPFTVRVEPSDIVRFATLAEAKRLLDREGGAGA